jgi:3-oxoacyl-[acyl-carrier protein] reductase
MERELEGRVALVTGASRNIGRAIALALAEAGASILVHSRSDRDAAEETAGSVERLGARAVVVLGDLIDPGVPAEAIASLERVFGRCDILVANAAIRPEVAFADMSFEEWRRVMALCLDSVFLLTRAALPLLKRSDQASIAMIGGMSGHSGAPHRAHVVAAKAGLTGFAKALAHELGPDGITVNTISPGMIETERSGAEPAHLAGRRNPLGRRGTPEDVASAVRILVGPRARYVTGQTLHVNGGALMP